MVQKSFFLVTYVGKRSVLQIIKKCCVACECQVFNLPKGASAIQERRLELEQEYNEQFELF